MEAPAIPMRMVMIMPPGHDPGMSHFASNPAMSPTTTQEMSPIFSTPPSPIVSFDEQCALRVCEQRLKVMRVFTEERRTHLTPLDAVPRALGAVVTT
jgi:hypothetical protein